MGAKEGEKEWVSRKRKALDSKRTSVAEATLALFSTTSVWLGEQVR